MRTHVHFGWLLGLIVLLPLAGASAQEPTLKDVLAGEQEEAAPAPTPEEKPAAAPALAPMGPLDDFDRGVPRTSVEGFTAAALAADWERAVEYLDLRSLPPGMDEYEGTELAHSLSVVLERALWIDLAQLSLEPEGRTDDGLPAYRDPVGVVETPEGKIPILLQRVPRGDGVSIWKFSNRTVGQVPTLYRYHGYGPLAEVLTALVPSFRLLGIESWQWVGMFGLGLVSFLLAWLLSIALARLLRVRQSLSGPRITRLVRGPIQFLVFVILFREGVHYLAPSLVLRAVLNTELFLIAAVSWTAFRVSDLLFDRSLEPLGREPGGVAVFLRPLRTASRTLIILAGSVLWLQNVGFNVGALLAGLGIGGVALALAAQKSLEDVFGAITLFSSRPVRVGDFCRFGDRVGTVEEIGLRWTRVRTLDHTVVNVPNGEFAKDKLENYSERRRSAALRDDAGAAPLRPRGGPQAPVLPPSGPGRSVPDPLRRVRRVVPRSGRLRLRGYTGLRRVPGDRRGSEPAPHGRREAGGLRHRPAFPDDLCGIGSRGRCRATSGGRGRGGRVALAARALPAELPGVCHRRAARRPSLSSRGLAGGAARMSQA
jgi:MscS family membrane protein